MTVRYHYELNQNAIDACYKRFSKQILDKNGIGEAEIKAIAEELRSKIVIDEEK